MPAFGRTGIGRSEPPELDSKLIHQPDFNDFAQLDKLSKTVLSTACNVDHILWYCCYVACTITIAIETFVMTESVRAYFVSCPFIFHS